MDLEKAVKDYERNISKLAEKNDIDFEIMLDNWKQKFKEFDKITDKYGFSDELDVYNSDETLPFISLTINGSILIVSEPDDDELRKVRYQSIKVRTDDSKNVPEIFRGKIKDTLRLSKPVIFENVIETSPIIMIKTSDNFDWDKFEGVAEQLTVEFTKRFEKIDNETITKQINQDI